MAVSSKLKLSIITTLGNMAVILLKMFSNLRRLATNASNVAPKLSGGTYYQYIVHNELIFGKLAAEIFLIYLPSLSPVGCGSENEGR